MLTIFWLGNLKGTDQSEDLAIEWWRRLTQDRDQWRSLVSTVMNLLPE
jgi:hypothetical protein